MRTSVQQNAVLIALLQLLVFAGPHRSTTRATQKNQDRYGLPIVDCGSGNPDPERIACYNGDNFVYEFFSGTGAVQDPTNSNSTGGNFFYIDVPGYPIHHEFRDDCWIQKWTHPNQSTYMSNVIIGKSCP
jgi:hypothetical protein